MMNNFIYPLISQIVLSLWLFIDFKTGQDLYYEATNAHVDLRYHDYRKQMFNKWYLIFIVLMFLVNEMSLSIYKELFYYKDLFIAPSIMTTLLIGIGTTSLYTDPQIHRVNRHSLRFVYFINLLSTIWFSTQVPINDGFMLYGVTIIIVDLIILYFLLFTTMMGASDLRAIMSFMPLYITVFKNFTIYIIALHFSGIALGHFLQKRKTKKSVPICHWLIVPAPFFALIYLIILKLYPEAISWLEVEVVRGLN